MKRRQEARKEEGRSGKGRHVLTPDCITGRSSEPSNRVEGGDSTVLGVSCTQVLINTGTIYLCKVLNSVWATSIKRMLINYILAVFRFHIFKKIIIYTAQIN